MHTTHTETSARPRRRGLRAVALAGVAVLALGTSAWDVPVAGAEVPDKDKTAAATYNAWKAGDPVAAAETATPEAVEQLFAKPWNAAHGWFYAHCSTTPEVNLCTWIDNTEGRLNMAVDKLANKVVAVERVGLGANIPAGRFFHAWRQGKSDNAKPYGSDEARFVMFSQQYEAADNWMPAGCTVTKPAVTRCTWAGNGNRFIDLLVDNDTKKVMAVKRYQAD